MEYLILVKWDVEKQETAVSVKEQNYTIDMVLDMLVNSLCMLVQTCTEKEHRLKDYELMNRIISCVKWGRDRMPEEDYKVIIKTNREEEWINISFPSEQGYLPIELTSDIVALAIHEIIQDDKTPEQLLELVLNVLNSQFVRTDLKPVSIDDAFLNK